MADNFDLLGSTNGSELQGGVVVPVQEFAIQTRPSAGRSDASRDAPGVYFQFRRPVAQLAKLDRSERLELIHSIATQLASRIEAVMAEPPVENMVYSQPTNSAGQLLDLMTVYVQSDSGNSQGTVPIPLAHIGPGDYTSSRINAEVDALNAAEGL